MIVYSNDPVGTLAGMLPLVGEMHSAIKYFSNDFLVAARHGWGMEYVVAVDRK